MLEAFNSKFFLTWFYKVISRYQKGQIKIFKVYTNKYILQSYLSQTVEEKFSYFYTSDIDDVFIVFNNTVDVP